MNYYERQCTPTSSIDKMTNRLTAVHIYTIVNKASYIFGRTVYSVVDIEKLS